MRLQRLKLNNFRGFAEADLRFEPDLTVIVGVNGAGKSTLLEATAALLSYLLRGIQSSRGAGERLKQDDIRTDAHEASCTLDAEIRNETYQWTLVATRQGTPRRRQSELASLQPVIEATQTEIAAGRFELPLAVFYPTNRAVLDIPDRIRERHEFGPLAAYDGALDSGGRNFRLFFEWFREQEDYENEQRLKTPGYRDIQLTAVRTAIERLVPGMSNLRVQRRPQRLVVDRRGRTLSLSQLSDGEKCLLAMVADLARRAALASPNATQPLDLPAVVLIDELELHLHPAWQRDIVRGLQQTFPHAQFVVTTHSPQVLGEVPQRCVRLLREQRIEPAPAPTSGRDSNRILQVLMGASARSEDVEARFAEIDALIDAEHWHEAWALVDALRERLGGDDPDVSRYGALLPARDAIPQPE